MSNDLVPNGPTKPVKKTPAKRTRKPAKPKVEPVVADELVIAPSNNNNTMLIVLGIVVVLVLLFGDKLKERIGLGKTTPTPVVNPQPSPTPAPTIVEGAKLQALVNKLQGNKLKANALAALFRDWAATLPQSQQGITTKQLLRAANTSMITLYVRAANVPKEPAVGAEIDAVLLESLGDKPGPLDVNKAVATFNAIASALDTVQ